MHGVARSEDLLPIGLAAGCRLTRAVARDEALSFADVERPRRSARDALWAEQLGSSPISDHAR